MSASAIATRRMGNLVAAIATVACCDIALGLTFQLLPLIMEARGTAAWLMGAVAAMGPAGILIAGPFLPAAVSRFGARNVVFVSLAVLVLTLLSFHLSQSLWSWFLLRFAFGVAAGALFTVSESWVLSIADDRNRGRIMSIYTSVLAITFSVGPIIIPWTGIEGWAPWLIGIACVLCAALPLAFVRIDDGVFERTPESGGFFTFVARAPMLLLAVATVTVYDSVLISFFTVYGLRSGLTLETASRILGFGIICNAMLFYPIGWLADHWSRRGTMIASAALTIVLSLSLIVLIGTPLIWIVMAVMTSSAFAAYIVALSMLGDSFRGSDLIAGSAAFAAMWGIGGLIGPPIAGAAVDAFGPDAIPASLAAFYAVLLACLLATRGQLIRQT